MECACAEAGLTLELDGPSDHAAPDARHADRRRVVALGSVGAVADSDPLVLHVDQVVAWQRGKQSRSPGIAHSLRRVDLHRDATPITSNVKGPNLFLSSQTQQFVIQKN